MNNTILIYLVDDLINLPDNAKFSGDILEYGFAAGENYYIELEELKEIYSNKTSGVDLFKLLRAIDKAEDNKIEIEIHCENKNPDYENVINALKKNIKRIN